MSSALRPKSCPAPGPFGWGVGVGLLLALAAAWVAWPYLAFTSWTVGADVIGQGIDRRGGARISVAHARGAMTQVCVGGCDDLQLRERLGDTAYEVRVLDGARKCVACMGDSYLVGGTRTRFTVGGAETMRIENGRTP